MNTTKSLAYTRCESVAVQQVLSPTLLQYPAAQNDRFQLLSLASAKCFYLPFGLLLFFFTSFLFRAFSYWLFVLVVVIVFQMGHLKLSKYLNS